MKAIPWREVAIPHKDVLEGSFQQAEFAADISQVHDGKATPEYQDPVRFFERTFITEGMRLLLDSLVKRLSGKGGDPVIQLQTAFGGGKTHTMLAVLHLASGKAPASSLPGVGEILDRAGVVTLPQARIAVLDGTKLSPNQPRKVGGVELRTLWGELAWQLGKEEGYALVADSDASGTAPGKEVLVSLLQRFSPCVILVDELVAYVRQFEGSKSFTGGTYDSQLSFIQSLTEALKQAPSAILLASLPESEREAGSDRGIAALKALQHYFSRIQAIWKPVGTEEAFEIVRRRLFASVKDQDAAEATCRAFAEMYLAAAADLPGETQEASYEARLRSAYPIHPEVFERLYRDWSTLPSFQRTRGVLKLMARVIHRLWANGNQDALIMPGSIPLDDPAVAAELITYLPPGWDPVVERDVDGPRSEAVEIDQRDPRFGPAQAARRVTRTVFLGSASGGNNDMARGIETSRIVLGCLQPGQAPHLYKDVLSRLETRLTYLGKGNGRWWLDVKPNLRREMEERKRRFKDEETTQEVRQSINRLIATGPYEAVHVFVPSSDIPDEWGLRIVVLPLDDAWTRTGPNKAKEAAEAVLKFRGEQPRQKQNRLLFLVADADQVMHLKDITRTLLAWRSILSDLKDNRITLDNLQHQQAKQNLEQVDATLYRLVRETFKWLLVPTQMAKPGQVSAIEWEALPLNAASQNLSKEIERVADENEAVISAWSPIHLQNLLKQWFWTNDRVDVDATDVWQTTCRFVYMPRLSKSMVLQSTISAGAGSRDFFGLAFGKNEGGTYRGFTFGQASSAILDQGLLLIEPARAAEEQTRVDAERAPKPNGLGDDDDLPPKPPIPGGVPPTPAPPPRQQLGPKPNTRYWGTVHLDPDIAGVEFSRIADEIIQNFATATGVKVKIRVDIEAEAPSGFSEALQRAIKENAKTLKFDQSSFD